MSTSAMLTMSFSSKVGFEEEFSTSCSEFMIRLSTLAYAKIDYKNDNKFEMFYDRVQHFKSNDLRNSIEDLPIRVDVVLDIYDGESDPREYLCLDNMVVRVYSDDANLEDLMENL